jgi:type I restriction enzyme M protein
LLNSDTKRHIDAARDVLVGVAPNPTTQIDQITYALIYKFMDDMDQASVKAGGAASFFVGDLEKYAWRNLMSTRLGNQEKMDLYSEALTKFSEAKQLPELFRTIFRAAFLPYRSPETLGLFLKEISYFDYTHPEELGNAYEYLLSIMSSQGDAGQFRTPRHIIDFIVDVINPTKDDRILDPACGTGGFLVSTYNHILEQHDGKNESKLKEKPLTPDERKKLMSNLQGYDIDPTMVRIAQVNMFLHQFKNPQIFQYDSLTSEERWSDRYDVILANPPFMSPKGGIKPHNKFGVSSNRAEVLFVDYIINHLKPKGRAGIVVPEGVIFQSGKAYKELRKNLIENGLYAVVSLPGGVFQPYSGVKTSILFIDNEIAKKKTEVAFVRIEADGFDLGATKRAISQNDLPSALKSLKMWATEESIDSPNFSLVDKIEIAAKGDYNLSGERYKVAADYSRANWPIVMLEHIANIKKGSSITQKETSVGAIPVIAGGQKPAYFHNVSNRDGNVITVSASGAYAGFVNYFETPIFASDCSTIQSIDESQVLTRYIYFVLKGLQEDIYKFQQGGGQPHVYPKDLMTIKMPLPPLEVQVQVVTELEGYAAIISSARQIVENWKPSIDIEETLDMVSLSNFCRIQNGYAFSSSEMGECKEGYLPVIKIGNVGADGLIDTKCKFHAYSNKLDSFILTEGDIVVAMTGATVGKVATIPQGKFLLNQRVGKVEMFSDSISLEYVRLALQSTKFYAYCQATATGGAQGNISAEEILQFKIPLASVEAQLAVTLAADEERKQVASLRKLISTYEERTRKAISKLWDVSEVEI